MPESVFICGVESDDGYDWWESSRSRIQVTSQRGFDGVTFFIDPAAASGERYKADEWPWEAAVPVEGKAGDAIFFHVRTVHGSKENHASTPRPVFITRYRRPDDYVTVSGTTAANRSEAEKRSAEAKKTNNQLGLMVRGFRRNHWFDVEGAA